LLELRVRWANIVVLLVILSGSGAASARLVAIHAHEVPGPCTDWERCGKSIGSHYGDRSDGVFTIVFRVPSSHDPVAQKRLYAVMKRAAHQVPTGKVRQLQPAGDHVLYGDIVSTLRLADAKGYTGDVYRVLPQGGGVTSYATGQAAIQHDLDPIFSRDLRRGETIALPIALVVLLAVFGLSVAVTMPFLFAASTIMGTLGAVYLFAHTMTMATYVTNLVQLIGLGIAIDYSLLVIYRFREELKRGDGQDELHSPERVLERILGASRTTVRKVIARQFAADAPAVLDIGDRLHDAIGRPEHVGFGGLSYHVHLRDRALPHCGVGCDR